MTHPAGREEADDDGSFPRPPGHRGRRTLALRALLLAAIGLVSGCATVRRETPPGDRFPLDPREELAGPFPESVERGWEALGRGDPAAAANEFETAKAEGSLGAGDVGWIEAAVLLGRFEPALAACETALSGGEPTVPMLVACGEASARGGNPAAGYRLYVRAVARRGDRPALRQRTEELRLAARDALAALARVSAEEHRMAEARERMAEAMLVAPESVPLRVQAGEMEEAAGENERAFRHYRQAYEMDPSDVSVAEHAGNLALDIGEHGFAVTVFDALAKKEPRFKPKAEEARLAFRVANWPEAERETARGQRLTRAAAAALVWWMFPEVREARVTSGVIASDAVSRRDTRAFSRAVGLGLLEVDRETHRGSPDGTLTLAAGSRMLLRLVSLLRPSGVACLPKGSRPSASEAIHAAEECGFWKEGETGPPTGPAFTRALDRVRALVSETGESDDE